MHPPFYTPDTFVSRDIVAGFEPKPTIRRGHRPRVLQFLPAPGWPPIHPYLVDLVEQAPPPLPSGQQAVKRPVLHVVPEPRNTLRDAIGRFLIRLGQRMILENRPG